LALVLSLGAVALPTTVLADWSGDPASNTPVVTADYTQGAHRIISDGSGGFFAVWHDFRSGINWDIYAQRFDADGNPQWTPNGVPVCTYADFQRYPRICLDGSGGCIISWRDGRGTYGRIYVQRLNGNGVPQWAADGVIASANFPDADQDCPWIISDGQGGAIVSWRDSGVHLQRLSPSGARLWGDYVTISNTGGEWGQKLIPDGQGGAIITWVDDRGATGNDIYIQRVDSNGNELWGAGDVVVCDASGSQHCPRIIPASSGAIVMWQDRRDGSNRQIFAQKVDSSGTPQWLADGVCVFDGNSDSYEHGIASDGAGGAIITWIDKADDNVYARRIGSSGNLLWGTPTQITDTSDFNDVSDAPRKTVEDGAGGIITVWVNDDYDIYAQRVDGSGNTLWTDNGVLLCDAPDTRNCPRLACCEPASATGALAYWRDYRNSATTGQDIYMQGVDADGNLGRPYPPPPPTPAPRGVGGVVYPVNKLGILAPWIGLTVLLISSLAWFTLRRRRAQI